MQATPDTHKVVAYSLRDLLDGVQKGFDLGYRVEQTVNSQVVIGSIGYYTIVMQKAGKQVPALFKPKQEPVVSEPVATADTDDTEDIDDNLMAKQALEAAESFTPSIKFVVEQPKKKAGRPRSTPQSI